MGTALSDALETDQITDVIIAQTEAQRDAFWQVRETIPIANRTIGAVVSHDISVPLDRIADFIETASAAISKIGPFRINCFGHLGDGNLHFNIFPPKGDANTAWKQHKEHIQRTIHDLVAQMDGSISAEHGIGRFKAAELAHYGDPAKLAAMTAIKSALDPKGILNPGAIFPLRT